MTSVKKLDNKKGKKEMETTISAKIDRDFKDQLTQKAGQVPISIVVRKLLKKWLKDEVKLELAEEKD